MKSYEYLIKLHLKRLHDIEAWLVFVRQLFCCDIYLNKITSLM